MPNFDSCHLSFSRAFGKTQLLFKKGKSDFEFLTGASQGVSGIVPTLQYV